MLIKRVPSQISSASEVGAGLQEGDGSTALCRTAQQRAALSLQMEEELYMLLRPD